MATFQYRGRAQGGRAVEGQLDAPSAESAAGELAARGITPLRLAEVREGSDALGGFERWWYARQIKISDLTMFCRQMYTLTRAGVPIIRTLRGLGETARNPEFARVLGDVADKVESGHELAGAMQQHSHVFSSLFVSLVHVGERVGRLEEAFQQLFQYLELEEDTRKRIKSATRYPMLVVGAMAGALVVINIYVIPPFAKLFASFGSDLPWATKLLITSSELSVAYWPHAAVLLTGAYLGMRQLMKRDEVAIRWDHRKLKLPVVGSILERALLARFARTMSVTLSSGLPVTQSLSIVSRTVDNRWVGQRILRMLDGIERGSTLTQVAHESGLFTPLVLQMLGVGEETGAVEEVLRDVAEYYEREVDYDLKRIGDSIEPILIVIVGILVLILALGVYLPMWDMANAAKSG